MLPPATISRRKQNPWRVWVVALLLALLLPRLAPAAPPTPWQRDPLLSQLLVQQLLTDAQGFRWVATGDGVFRYDGHELVALNRLLRPGGLQLPGQQTTALAFDAAGRLWIGAQSGLYCADLRLGTLRQVPLPVVPAAQPNVRVLFCHPQSGQLWVGYADELVLVLAPALAATTTTTDPALAIAQRLGPARRVGGSPSFFQADGSAEGVWLSLWHPIWLKPMPSAPVARPAAVQLGPTGPARRVVAATCYLMPVPGPTPSQALHLFSSNAWYEASPNNRLRERRRWLPPGSENGFRPAGTTHPDSLREWVAGGHRCTLVVRGHRAGQVSIEPFGGVGNGGAGPETAGAGAGTSTALRYFSSLTQDPQGTYWCYSPYWRGCDKQQPTRRVVQALRLATGQPTPSVRGLGRLADGRLLVSTYGLLLAQAADSPNAPLRPLQMRLANRPYVAVAYDLLVTREGPIVLAQQEVGVRQLDPATRVLRQLVPDPTAPGPPPGNAQTLLQDHRGRLWSGTSAGLFRLDLAAGYVRRVAATHPALPLHRLDIVDLADDPATGTLWLATTTGLYAFEPATEALHRVGGPAGPGRPLPTDELLCVVAAGPGRVWAGTRLEGLLLADAQTGLVRQVGMAEGLPSNTVGTVLRQPDGTLWAGTYAGLVRYDPATQRLAVFTQAEGLVDAELNRNAAYADPATGTLLFGGVGGLHRVRPSALGQPLRQAAPHLLATAVAEPTGPDGETVHLLQPNEPPTLHLATGPTAYVELRLALTHLFAPSLNHYAYRLREVGSTGNDATGQPTDVPWLATPHRLLLRGLAAGNYVVEVRAETPTGQQATNLLRVPLHVDRVWWQHPLAWALAAVLLVLLGYGLFWLQGRRARREARLREELAANLHDEVGTLLTKISLMAEVLQQPFTAPGASPSPEPGAVLAARPATGQLVERLLLNSRAAAQAMRDVVWSIDSRADSVPALLDRMRDYLDQVADTGSLSYTLETDPPGRLQALRPVVRKHLFLIFKEAVTNTLRHGKNATALHVRLVREGTAFVLELTDNGRPDAPVGRSGQGLRNMASRAQALSATLQTGPRPDGEPGFRVRLVVRA